DGDNNAGQIDPDSAAAICAGLGIKVYTVAVGTAIGTVIIHTPVGDPITGQTGVRRVAWNVRVDVDLLQRIAKRTGGRFYRATDASALRDIFTAIDHLERTPLQVKKMVRHEEAFQPLA